MWLAMARVKSALDLFQIMFKPEITAHVEVY